MNLLPRKWLRFAFAGLTAAALAVSMGAPAQARVPTEPDAAVASDGSRAVGPAQSSGLHGISGTSGSGAVDPRSVPPADGPVRAPQEGPGASEVIGDDDREYVDTTTSYPVRAIVQIEREADDGTTMGCTGWMYGSDTLATAGHCVHPGSGEDGGGGNGFYPVDSITVTPARDGDNAPYGTCQPTLSYSVLGWTDDGAETHDYGAMKLDCQVGDVTGTWGLWWQDDSLDGTGTSVSGYPCDLTYGEQYRHTGQSVEHSADEQVFYANDTAGCQSGSPVYERRPDGDDWCASWCVMAVHAYGRHGDSEHGMYNHGTRITEAAFDNLIDWRSA